MRVALTGGASGIGAAVLEKLVADGHDVVAFDVKAPSVPCRFVQTDLSDPVSIAAAIAQVEGPFDALINNAGLPPREGLSELILKVNFFGLRQFLYGMLDKMAAGASIVNTASRAGAFWRDNLDEVKALITSDVKDVSNFIEDRKLSPTRCYNLSKEAVIVMTIAATEQMIKRGLRMNAASPAAISTDILQDFAAAFGEKMAKNVGRVGRPGTAQEAADVIVFLASPESNWIKGQDIAIDGGMSAWAMTEALELPHG